LFHGRVHSQNRHWPRGSSRGTNDRMRQMKNRQGGGPPSPWLQRKHEIGSGHSSTQSVEVKDP
jgi:hypothetical protein